MMQKLHTYNADDVLHFYLIIVFKTFYFNLKFFILIMSVKLIKS